MFQPELTMDSIFDQIEHHDFNMDALVDFCDFDQFPTLFTTTEDNSELPSLQMRVCMEVWKTFSHRSGILFPGQDPYFNGGIFPLQPLPSEGEGSFSPSQSMNSESVLTDVVSVQSSLSLLGEDMEIDNQLGLFHLLKAYGEALEKDQRELGQVILRRISEKGSSVGKTLERLAFYLPQDSEINQVENLKEESLKNFGAAFQALYQALPDGKFAHFAANSAILEVIPDDAETIHIVDFDMGEEARIALDCLFVAPCISSLAFFQRWKEIRGGCHLEAGLRLVGRRLSKEIFMEAREMVDEEKNKYGIKIEGQIGNEMVLEWKRNTIVRISTWTNHS
ncbi:scarecrow-like protein 7 [Quercus suber]|uniref:Scarecrow-like protein 7 n=1 Tax=Quercus suber TaxID=58331 RepID=A0AAW0M0G0_QUESU